MKLPQILLAAGFALAALTSSARAETLLPTNDTYSTLYFNTARPPVLTKSLIAGPTGASPYLVVSKVHHAFIKFDAATKLTAEGITAADIASAKLAVYFPIVIKAGEIDLHQVTSSWSEAFTGTVPEPSFDSANSLGHFTPVAKQFASIDVTATVQAWLNGTADDGFALDSSDPLTLVALGAKEGPGSGYPATLEIEVKQAPSLFQDSNGNVGIGTTSPASTLEVNGTAIVDQDLGVSGSGVFGANDNAVLGADAFAPLRLGFVKKFGSVPVIASDAGDPIIFSNSDQTGLLSSNIRTANVTELMRITPNGRVGIGT